MTTKVIAINTTTSTHTAISNSLISSIPDLVIAIAVIIAIVVILYFLFFRGRPKKIKSQKDSFFVHLKELYNADLKLNSKAYLILPSKRLNIKAYKKEKWDKTEFYIIQISRFITTDFYFIEASEITIPTNSSKPKKPLLISPKNTNFYTIGKGFHVQASLIPLFENYISDTGIFRTTAETTLNQLYQNRTKERVLESNELADSLKLKEAEKQNFIETYKEMNNIRKI